jgi:hypothetical protein
VNLYRERPEPERVTPRQRSAAEKRAEAEERLHESTTEGREAALAMLEAELAQRVSIPPAKVVLEAAHHILDTLSALALDDDFWADVEAGERALAGADPTEILAVAEIIQSDLAGLLDASGYRPPPPSVRLATDIQAGFQSVIGQSDAMLRAEVSRETRRHLLVYVYHLRPLLEAAEDAKPNSHDGRLLRRRIFAAARAGALALGPAVVATGAAAVMFSPQSATAGALVYGATEAMKELVRGGIKEGAMVAMRATLAGQTAAASPEAQFRAAADMLLRSAVSLESVADNLSDRYPEDIDPLVRASAIAVVRWCFEVERARIGLEQPQGATPSPSRTKAVRRAADELRQWTESDESYDVCDEIRARLNLAVRQLVPDRSDPDERMWQYF